MPYNSLIDRTSDANALIPEDVAREIIKGTTVKSAALQLFRHRTMTRQQQRMPVLSLLPTAYWVNGDTGLKQTTEQNWTNKYLDAEELAAIVPIPEKLLDDVDYDLWTEIKPELEAAIAVAVDGAVFFGTNKPSSWPSDIITAAVAAGNTVTVGTSTLDILDDINELFKTVEADGYEVNGSWARVQMKGALRGLRDANNNLLFNPGNPGQQGVPATLLGERLAFSVSGLTGFGTSASNYSLIAGDWNQGIMGVRQDITFKMLDQAVLTDAANAIIYNLPQQDMVAMRAVARFAFQVPNPVNRQQATEGSRYPFAALKQRAATGGE